MIENYRHYIDKKRYRNYFLLGGLLLAFIGLGLMVDFSLVRIYKGLPSMYNLLQRMSSPNLHYRGEVLSKLLETIEIAILASFLGVFLSIPFALFTAVNITPYKPLAVILNGCFAFLRTIPSLIWAALLVSIFSIGKFPGIMALTLTAFLVALKLFKEHIETIGENLIQATKSVGANPLQVLRYCVLPTITELGIAVFFIVFEINIRSATVLGLVGAGGIGQMMWRDLNHLRYDNLGTLILILLLTILLIDGLSLVIRKQVKNLHIQHPSLAGYRRFCKIRVFFLIFFLILLVLIVVNAIDIEYARIQMGVDQVQSMVRRMGRMEFAYWPRLVEGVAESFFIAIFATLTGSVGALFLVFFTAYNTAPLKQISLLCKGMINILRTFPPIVTAIIFFRGVGPGPLAGAMALSIYTLGVVTKLYSEIIESTHENIQNAVLVTGASPFASFRYGILPQTLPNFISLILYRLESNIRTSTILGIIGAGGVGTILSMNITWRNWERVGFLLLGISVMIIAIDGLSYYIRRKLC